MRSIILIVISIILVAFQNESLAQSTRYEMGPDSVLVISSGPLVGLGPIIGYRGVKSNMLEIGATFSQIGHGVEGFEVSYLNNLQFNEDRLSGFSAGYFRGFAIFEIGILGTYYTNFDQHGLYARPHVALGYGGILTIGYGYNIPFSTFDLKEQVARHELRFIARWAIGAY